VAPDTVTNCTALTPSARVAAWPSVLAVTAVEPTSKVSAEVIRPRSRPARAPPKAMSKPPVTLASVVTVTLAAPIVLSARRAVWICAAVASKFSALVVWPA
jgi:hypothetical protein